MLFRSDTAHIENTSILSYNNENSLSCVIAIAYFSARREYMMIREMPAGKGFADIVFLPRAFSNKPVLIVELKWNNSVSGAIRQIKERAYVSALEEYRGEVLLIAINYDKRTKIHQCIIERFQKDF